jgi:hypothetical protein
MSVPKKSPDVNKRVTVALREQGFEVTSAEVERIVAVLSGIERDLAKLDELANEQHSTTPHFNVDGIIDDRS